MAKCIFTNSVKFKSYCSLLDWRAFYALGDYVLLIERTHINPSPD